MLARSQGRSTGRSAAPRSGLLAVISILVVGLTACGAVDDGDGPDGGAGPVDPDRVQVADQRFDGGFLVTAVVLGGEPVELATIASVAIETEFGGLEVLPGCNTYFGSFSLEEDGTASFTIPGGSAQDCGPELGAQEEAVLAALTAATGWVETGDGFRFEGPDSSITIAP
ncbi:MAG: META domain-containing protein [Actinomycetota bacterium]